MKRTALTIWNGRISPVFESAGRILVVDIENGHELSRVEYALPADPEVVRGKGGYGVTDTFAFGANAAFKRIEKLTALGTEVLVCGAISACSARLVNSAGITVIGWVSGDVEEVVRALLTDNIDDSRFIMPGCGRYRRGQRGRCGGRAVRGRGGWGFESRGGAAEPMKRLGTNRYDYDDGNE